MPEATVVIQELLEKKSEKAPNAAKDGNGTFFKSWDIDFAPFVGKKVKLKWGVKEREYGGKTYKDNFVTELEGPLAENGEHPPLGTGEYVKGQTAPADKASINRSVALKASVSFFAAYPEAMTLTPKAISDKVGPLAQAFVTFLETGKWPGQLADEDVPF